MPVEGDFPDTTSLRALVSYTPSSTSFIPAPVKKENTKLSKPAKQTFQLQQPTWSHIDRIRLKIRKNKSKS